MYTPVVHFPLHFYWSDSWALLCILNRCKYENCIANIFERVCHECNIWKLEFSRFVQSRLTLIGNPLPPKSFEPTRVICIRFHLCPSIFVSAWKYCSHFWKYSWNIRNYPAWIQVYFGNIYNVQIQQFLKISIHHSLNLFCSWNTRMYIA